MCVCVCMGGGVGKEGWKLDERGRLSHQPDHANSFFFLFDFSVYYAIARLRALKKRHLRVRAPS